MPPFLPRALALLLAAPLLAQAQNPAPFRVYANTYYVGTQDASSVLITSNEGHVLIDAGLPESAGTIIANIAALGFRIEDVKMIMNSHGHAEHAGGLENCSGAAMRWFLPARRRRWTWPPAKWGRTIRNTMRPPDFHP
jgi:metallo-beta-lactamase class B